MAPATLPNLYTRPSDVYDLMSSEGVDLRLDDHRLATSQRVVCTTSTALGDTSVAVLPIQYPLLPGTVLQFDGAGMPAQLAVTVSALAKVGDTTVSVNALVDQTGAPQQVMANAFAFDSGVNLALAARLVKGCNYGTSQVKLYCCPRYQDSDLATCWSANYWSTAIAARWVGRRRGLPAPKSLEAMCGQVYEQLQKVRAGQLNVEDIPTRTTGWPFMVNVSVEIGYDFNKMRVEPQLSDPTPPLYPQYVSWDAALWLEW